MRKDDNHNVYSNEENANEENGNVENGNEKNGNEENVNDENVNEENGNEENDNKVSDSKENNNEASSTSDRKKTILIGGIVVIAILAVIAVAFFVLRGSRSLSNDYITIHQYRGLEITQMEPTEITDDHVENMIQQILHENIEQIEITDRPAQMGDFVTIDFAGSVDGEYFEGGTAEGEQLHLGSMSFIGPQGDYDGFEEQIVGHNVGDNFDIQIQFPEPYHAPHLEGKVANFNITLHAIIEHVVPVLSDEWVQEISDVSTTVEEYREEIREQLAENDRLSMLNRQKTEALIALMENVEVIELPRDVVESELDVQVAAFKAEAEQHGIEFDVFLAQVYQIDEATFMAEMERFAEESAKVKLTFDLVIERERLDASEEAIAERIAELAEQNRMTVAELMDMVDEQQLEGIIRQLIVAEFLVEHAVEVAPEVQEAPEALDIDL